MTTSPEVLQAVHELRAEMASIRAGVALHNQPGWSDLDDTRKEIKALAKLMVDMKAEITADLSKRLSAIQTDVHARDRAVMRALAQASAEKMVEERDAMTKAVDAKLASTAGSAADSARQARDSVTIEINAALDVLRTSAHHFAHGAK